MNMETREHIEETAAEWIAKRDLGPWAQADNAEFTAWLAASVGHRAAYYRLNAAWQEAGRLQALHAGEISAPPLRGEGVARSDRRGVRSAKQWSALAASVVLAIAMSTTWHLWPTGPSFRTEVGGLAAVPLADGSKITLNTDSEIRVAVSETERHIDLSRGEAYFEVAKDPARPFIVQAGDKRVVAIGTKFSVRHDSSDIQVVVTEGRVRVEIAKGKLAPIEIGAGTIARAKNDALLVEENRATEIERNLTWRTGQLTFRDTPLADAVAEFNRYNTRKIVIEDPAVAALQVGGIFRATNVDPFVRLLEEAFPIHVTQVEDRIVLTAAN